MVSFIFTTCTTICLVMTSTFRQVQEKLGKDRNDVRLEGLADAGQVVGEDASWQWKA